MRYRIDVLITSDRPGPDGKFDIRVIDDLAAFETKQQAIDFAELMAAAAIPQDETALDAEVEALISGVRP